MKLNEARDIRMGTAGAKRVCLGTQTVWEKPPVFMPYMVNVTSYFDHDHGFSGGGWRDLIGSTDITFTGNVQRGDDCIRVAGGAWGTFPCGSIPAQFTAYLIARAPSVSLAAGQYFLSDAEPVGGNGGFTIGMGGEAYARPEFRTSVSAYTYTDTRTPGNQFHVFAVSVSGQYCRCFADGQYCGSIRYRAGDVEGLFLGRLPHEVSAGANEYRFLAFANKAHSDSNVWTNSQWLMAHYGISPMTGYRFPPYIQATGGQQIDLGSVQIKDSLYFRMHGQIDSIVKPETAILHVGDRPVVMMVQDDEYTTYAKLVANLNRASLQTARQSVNCGSYTRIVLQTSASESSLSVGSSLVTGIGVEEEAVSGNYSIIENGFFGQLYSIQIGCDGMLIRDMLPVVRTADEKPGLYDFVTHGFFGNAGTGEFVVPN